MVTELNLIRNEEDRFQKDRALKAVMLKVLSQHEKDGIKPEDLVKQVQSMVKVSRGKIFNVIKDFHFHGLIRIETDSKDRRRKRYYPNIGKVKAQTAKFKIEDFLKQLKNPQSFEYEKAVGEYDLAVSFLFEHHRKVELMSEIQQQIPLLMTLLEPFMKETKLETFAVFIGCHKR